MSSRGQICPWHDISLAVVVERVDYLFKNQKHDSTITYYTIPLSTSALSHLVLFTWNFLDLHKKVAWLVCLLFLSVWITHQKTHIHINYILYTTMYFYCWFYLLQNRKYVFIMSGEKNQSELPENRKKEKKNSTMHSLVIIQLYFWLILEWIIQW